MNRQILFNQLLCNSRIKYKINKLQLEQNSLQELIINSTISQPVRNDYLDKYIKNKIEVINLNNLFNIITVSH